MSAAATATALGIDLGGTNLRVCLVDAAGRRLAEDFGAVPASAEADAIIAVLIERCRGVLGNGERSPAALGIGLGVAGALDAEGRLIAGMTNLPALAGRPLRGELAEALGLPVRIENDARAAMRGEACFGAARGVRDALMLTLGTGIGGGLLLDGTMRAGPHRLAGEVGLTLVPDAGAAGWEPLEDAASPGGLARTRGLDLADVVRRAAAGDADGAAGQARVAELVAVAIVNAQVTLDLELVLLSGGLIRAGAPLLAEIRGAFERLCPAAFKGLRIELAQLGEWAGAMGAAALWLGDGSEGERAP